MATSQEKTTLHWPEPPRAPLRNEDEVVVIPLKRVLTKEIARARGQL